MARREVWVAVSSITARRSAKKGEVEIVSIDNLRVLARKLEHTHVAVAADSVVDVAISDTVVGQHFDVGWEGFEIDTWSGFRMQGDSN